jgi:hypothetical protein
MQREKECRCGKQVQGEKEVVSNPTDGNVRSDLISGIVDPGYPVPPPVGSLGNFVADQMEEKFPQAFRLFYPRVYEGIGAYCSPRVVAGMFAAVAANITACRQLSYLTVCLCSRSTPPCQFQCLLPNFDCGVTALKHALEQNRTLVFS